MVACNTASAYALEALQQQVDIPVIGVVRPGARVAARESVGGNIGVISTAATAESHIYRQYIQSLRPEAKVFEKACPLFVPLVEEGWRKDPVTRTVAERYLQEMKDRKVDTLILGCTHYPLLRSMVADIMGPDVVLVNPAYETAMELKRLLHEHQIENLGGSKIEENPYEFFVSDQAEKFRAFADSILPIDITTAKQVPIEEY